jgi:hypothetical protein
MEKNRQMWPTIKAETPVSTNITELLNLEVKDFLIFY